MGRPVCALIIAETPIPDAARDRVYDWHLHRNHISHVTVDQSVDKYNDRLGLYYWNPPPPGHRFRCSTFPVHRRPLRGHRGRLTGPHWTLDCFGFYPCSGTDPPGRYGCTARRPYRPHSAVDNGENGPAGPAVRLIVNLISHLVDLAYRLVLGATREARSLHGCSLMNVCGGREQAAVGFCCGARILWMDEVDCHQLFH